MNYKLSILICNVSSRFNELQNLIKELNFQIQTKPVQVLWIGDNKSISVGEKRNQLLTIAKGEYVTFIDDDDSISKTYINDILDSLNGQVVTTFKVKKTFNGKDYRTQIFSKNYGRNHNSPDKLFTKMLPNHLCVWKRDSIKEVFPNKSLSEDHKWAEKMTKHYDSKDEYHIDKILYYYKFDSNKTETQNLR